MEIARLSNTALLTLVHFIQPLSDADHDFRDAASLELYKRGLIEAETYSCNVRQSALQAQSNQGGSNWRDELWHAVTPDEDSLTGHFYQKVLGTEPPVYPRAGDAALEVEENQSKELRDKHVSDLLKDIFDWSLIFVYYAIGTPDNHADQELLEILEQSLRERKLLTEDGELDADALDDNIVLWILEQLVDAQESLNQLLALLYHRLQHRHYERNAAELARKNS